MTFETIELEIAERVATVTINRPEQSNSFNGTMVREFRDLWSALARDSAVNCCVLRAAPGRAFSTGMDVKQGWKPEDTATNDNVWNDMHPGQWLGPKSMQCWKPVVCAVHGMAAGGAFYWINEADIVICSEDATFFDPHVTYGMTSALEPIGMMSRMPLGDVLRMVLLGNHERVSAYAALRMALVSEVVPPGDLWARAGELARIIAGQPPAATEGSVKAIWQALDMPRSVALANGMKYCQLGNPVGTAQVDRGAIMADKARRFALRD
ncbi:MAG: enoyl-CoA hydratase/isomerase family protein [Novosphingobium sp.]|nr:enoyl-CoA hydratase/isomerase family protein [Novosphingobium sp.]